jgi:hypothetical protein
MTRYEAEATNGYTGSRPKGVDWTQLLVPIVAAALVIALGLAFVGLTGQPDTQLNQPPAAAGTF